MSQESVEVVRAVYEEWGKGNFRAGADLLDPQVLFIVSPDFPDAGAYLGTDSVSKFMLGFLAPWKSLTITAEDFIEAGDSVVVAVHQRGVGQESDIPTDLRYFAVWTFRGGAVIRLENVRDRAEALEAVGLRE